MEIALFIGVCVLVIYGVALYQGSFAGEGEMTPEG